MAEQNNKSNPLNVEEALTTSEAFIIKNKNLLITVIVAVVVIVAGFFLYKHFVATPKEEKAATMLAKGQEYFSMDQYEVALRGDSVSYKGFIKIAEDESGTDAGNLANAYAGLCLAHLGQYKEAIKYLEAFSGGDLMVGPAVKGALGDCYAHAGDLDKATTCFMDAAKESDSNSLSPIFLKKAGEIYEKLGRNEDAVKAYQTIKDKYFNSYVAADIDKYIDRASGK